MTAESELLDVSARITSAAQRMQGPRLPAIELRDIPDENWRRLRAASDARRLAQATAQLGSVLATRAASPRTVRNGNPEYQQALATFVLADMVADDCAKVGLPSVAQPSLVTLLKELDGKDQSPLRNAARQVWAGLRQVRNQLLHHRNPEYWLRMDIDPDGGVQMEAVHRMPAVPVREEGRRRLAALLTDIGASVPSDASYDDLCALVFAHSPAMGCNERRAVEKVYISAGFKSPPMAAVLSPVADLMDALGSCPTFTPPKHPAPPYGAEVYCIAAMLVSSPEDVAKADALWYTLGPVFARFLSAGSQNEEPAAAAGQGQLL